MQLACPHCHATLEFAEKRPLFCAFCGHALTNGQAKSVVDLEAPTLAPSSPTEATAERGMPDAIGGYRLLRRIGGGGMGAVFEAEENASGRKAAVKLIAPDVRASAELVERFRQEGRLASAVVHPRCVFVLNADEQDGQPYIVMELMPGSTLQDLVQEKGPLPLEDAITKILDVIDGLEAAHKLGVIHRDVKPSNCFLEADGRVKIGDFGLSKSLIKESNLTRTGAFLGTTLYASPEQVRGDRVDQQTDVYSVAATLYFLLTGKAPFQTGDAAATLARIVSDPAPSLRELRPEIPAALDRVVLRGLEKSRERRWASLHDFRAVLALFLPAKASIGSLGLRFAAYLIDFVILVVVIFAIEFAFGFGRHGYLPSMSNELADTLHNHVLNWLTALAYFALLEGLFGCSVGKWLLRLRVCRVGSRTRPGFPRALARVFTHYVLDNPYSFATCVFLVAGVNLPRVWHPGPWVVYFLMPAAGVLLVFSSIRKRNGYRGLHEFASGTRVIQLPWPRRQRVIKPIPPPVVSRPNSPERLGAFRLQGVLHEEGDECVILGEDTTLGRRAWIWLRPSTGQPLSAARQDCSRPTRPRWLGGGEEGDRRWDAFLALPGCSLPALARSQGKLPWADVRPLLEDLIDELTHAEKDGTLPRRLTPEQIWLSPDGRAQLLDAPFQSVPSTKGEPPTAAPLGLVRDAALLALEGKPRSSAKHGPVRAPLPEHALRLTNRLLAVGPPYQHTSELQADFVATQDRPAQVTRGLRAAYLALFSVLVVLTWLFTTALVPSYEGVQEAMPTVRKAANRAHDAAQENPPAAAAQDSADDDTLPRLTPEAARSLTFAAAAFLPSFWVLWSLFFRGGLIMRWLGLTLAGARGGLASRWRCALRTFLMWAPVVSVFLAIFWLPPLLEVPDSDTPEFVHLLLAWAICLWGAVFLLLLYAVAAVMFPRRCLHDLLAGTCLVPR
jgi:hypothetical protein